MWFCILSWRYVEYIQSLMINMEKLASVALLVLVLIPNPGITQEFPSHDEGIWIRAGDPVTYTAGVFEFEPYCEWTEEGGAGIVRENARLISQFASDAKDQGVDILVAAEYGLQSLDMHGTNATQLFSLMQYVPDPVFKDIPCTMTIDPPNTEALQTLSCAAKENQIYLIVDLAEASPCSPDVRNPYNNSLDLSRDCPKKGYIYYNTQVVFDRDGAVIARYRKKNLFLEWEFVPGFEPNEEAIFTTDFGVTFTLQICFDIAFFNPGVSNIVNYGIRDVVMSTAWMDMLPYHIAPAVQNGFSRGLGINLIVSGYHRPEQAKMGSGIYRGASDLTNNYIFDSESGSKLLVSEVDSMVFVDVRLDEGQQFKHATSHKMQKIEQVAANSIPKSNVYREHTIYYDDLSNYTHVFLVQGESKEVQHAEACHQDNLCCQLSYYPTSNLNYSLLAYSGPVIKGFGEYSIYAQVCSVLWCPTDDVNTCTHIEGGLPESDSFRAFTLSGSFSTNYTFPIIFDRNLTLTDNDFYKMTVLGQEVTITANTTIHDLMTAGVYGRWYERDP